MDYRSPGSSVHRILQASWSGLSFPPPGDLPDPGIEAASFASPALTGGFFTPELLRIDKCIEISGWIERQIDRQINDRLIILTNR